MTEILILDGGLGTSLEQNYGINFNPSTPLWSSHLLVSDQDTLLTCQRDFGAVPVDIILTATYQASIEGFAKTKTDKYPDGIPVSSIPRFINDAVTIAEKAKCPDAGIALGFGCYGACMMPSREYSGVYDASHSSIETLKIWHQERMQLFARSVPSLNSRIRFVAIETVPRVDEIIAVRKALSSVEKLSIFPFWISCLFPGDNEELPDGTNVEDTVTAMLDPAVSEAKPWGIGVNCTKTWKLDSLLERYETTISSLIKTGRLHSWPALVLYPDGTNGEVYNTETKTWELPTGTKSKGRGSWQSQVANVVKRTQERGKWPQIVVGGCCMASHENIRRLRECLLPRTRP